MRLLNDFYTIVERKDLEDGFCCRVKLNPEHGIYQAHFPGNPITPGVCLLQMASEILEQQYGKSFVLQTALSIKFKTPIVPDDVPMFVFTNQIFAEDEFRTNISIAGEGVQYVKMTLKFKIISH